VDNVRRATRLERVPSPSRGKALKEKPQERYRYETRPSGFGRSKPLGGRETLEGERTGLGKPGSSGLPIPEALKGNKSHERDLALPSPMYVGRCASKAGNGQNCSGLAPDGFRTAGEASLTVCNYLESVHGARATLLDCSLKGRSSLRGDVRGLYQFRGGKVTGTPHDPA
jgi:hypothetical protein